MIAKSNSLTASILTAAVPEWADAHAAADRLESEVRRRIAERTDGVEDRNAAAAALREAEGPAAMQSILDADRLATARREAESADIALLASARDRAQSAVQQIEGSATEDVVTEVRNRVEAIARKVNGLRNRPLSAQEAIDLDAAQEWKTLQQLAGEWTALGKAFVSLVRHETEGPSISALAPAALTGDPLNVHPYFIARRREAGRAYSQPRPDSFHSVMLDWSASAPTTQFNTDQPKGAAIPQGADPVAWIVYLVEHDALTVQDPWTALDLWDKATAATDTINASSAESRAVARVEYARATGDDDLTTCEDLRPIIEQGKRRPARGSFVGN